MRRDLIGPVAVIAPGQWLVTLENGREYRVVAESDLSGTWYSVSGYEDGEPLQDQAGDDYRACVRLVDTFRWRTV